MGWRGIEWRAGRHVEDVGEREGRGVPVVQSRMVLGIAEKSAARPESRLRQLQSGDISIQGESEERARLQRGARQA